MRRSCAVLLLAAAAGLTACGGPSPRGPVAPPSRIPTSLGPTPTRDVAENLTPPGAVRRQLVVAAAAEKQVPAADFTGLRSIYYAYDFTTRTFWAAAALVPSKSSSRAQTSVQDNGSFDLFRRPKGGQWRAYEVGAAGIAGTRCPVHVPPAVARRWRWPKESCRPPSP